MIGAILRKQFRQRYLTLGGGEAMLSNHKPLSLAQKK
jgi:hypothetical protein